MTHASSLVPRIDVLIPAYNVERTIEGSVKSILAQNFRDLRVIVVDDGSTDGTYSKLAALAAQDPRLLVHRQANGGIVDALNNGLALCTAEFVARHDGDDIAFANRLESQLAYLDAHPDCVAVGSNAYHIDETGRRTGGVTSTKNPAWCDVNYIPADEPYLMHPFLMVRRDSLVAIGGYRYVFHAEDTDLYWRLRHLGRLHNMGDLLGEYRIHTNSISGKSVLNGRIQAVYSQLAALSERRRIAGTPDLVFAHSQLQDLQEAKSLDRIMAVIEKTVLPAEVAHFRLAVVAKLLELESYRPYALERDDRNYINAIFAEHGKILSPDNLRFLNTRQAKYIAKRLRAGDFRAAAGASKPSLVRPLFEFLYQSVVDRLQKLLKR